MSENLECYLKMQTALYELRKFNRPTEEEEDILLEDILLDEMDIIWWKLTEDEKNFLNKK